MVDVYMIPNENSKCGRYEAVSINYLAILFSLLPR